ncbi:MAG TPA: hypothetical protein VH437_14240 [Terriglobales bacterium]|jgi:hypothetical protein
MSRPIFTATIILLLVCSSYAQDMPSAAGHWEGSATIPGHNINIAVDLSQDGTNLWSGSMSFPDEKSSAMRLSGITIKADSVTFQSPATSKFEATIAADGQTMTGSIQLAARLRPVQLKRTSAPPPLTNPSSTTISKQLEGTWQGVLKYGKTWGEMTPPEGNTPEGASFGIRIRFSTGNDGTAVGGISRLDEPGAELPIDLVQQRDEDVRIEIFSAAVVFIGQLRGDVISGEWRQLGAEPRPFALTRSTMN